MNSNVQEYELEHMPVTCIPPFKSTTITKPTKTHHQQQNDQKTTIDLSSRKPSLKRQSQICDEAWNIVEPYFINK